MRVVHDILHIMSEGKEDMFSCSIHIATATHGKVLKIISFLYSYMHEATNPFIEGTPT